MDEVFNLNSGNQGYQRRYTTIVAAKTEDCYFIENVHQDQLINFHFMVRLNDDLQRQDLKVDSVS